MTKTEEKRQKDMFRGDLDFLSNFYNNYPHQFNWKGVSWCNAEAAYQWSKIDPERQPKLKKMFQYLDPSDAKQIGKIINLREDWEEVKVDIMKSIVTAKFTSNSTLGQKLKGTGKKQLIEWNWWNDVFWGKSIKTGKGENILGKILMEIRDDIL